MTNMNQEQHGNQLEPLFDTELLVPTKQKVGDREIEVTYIGSASAEEPTWILWNADEPYLIGMVRQSNLGYTFEQRTSVGPLVHKNLSGQNVHRILGS